MLVVFPPHQVWNKHLRGVGDAGRGWNNHLGGVGDVEELFLLAQCPRAQGFGSPGIWSLVVAVILPVSLRGRVAALDVQQNNPSLEMKAVKG